MEKREKEVRELQALLAKKEDENAALRRQVDWLTQQLRLTRGQRFGASSEKTQGILDPEELLKKYNISPAEVQRALARAAWDTLLLQLDDDTCDFPAGEIEDMDLYLGGFGALNLLIRSEDLKNRDFSKILACWACT